MERDGGEGRESWIGIGVLDFGFWNLGFLIGICSNEWGTTSNLDVLPACKQNFSLSRPSLREPP